MYIDRDAKILLIYNSIVGIVTFVGIYLAMIFIQQKYPNDNFGTIQIIIFSIISGLTIILLLSIYSLKKEIANQQDYLQNLQQTTQTSEGQIVKIPYNKSGLYAIIVTAILGIIAFLYLFNVMVLQPPPPGIGFQKGALETISYILFGIIIVLIIILLITMRILVKRIQVPLYYEYKPCPKCGSSDLYKVEYSWWGGLVGPALVHQVRCKKCGKIYNGATGTDITKKIIIFIIIANIVFFILLILRYIL
ncbi:MAG: hypothetical protein NT038_05325 [Euryarchaeota archaeon]|nr:hypothetical protein [Euryarchaeota archaeon]